MVYVKKENGSSNLCSCHYKCYVERFNCFSFFCWCSYSPFWIYSCEKPFCSSQKVLMHVLEEAGFTKDSHFTVPDFMKVKSSFYSRESCLVANVYSPVTSYTGHQKITSCMSKNKSQALLQFN
jgi:hypothetical protein